MAKPKATNLAEIKNRISAATNANPLTRTAVTGSVVQMARGYAMQAMQALVAALDATDRTGAPEYRTRVQAASIILDRAYGKAPQVVEHLDRTDDATLEAMARAILLKRIQGSVDGGTLQASKVTDAPKLADPPYPQTDPRLATMGGVLGSPPPLSPRKSQIEPGNVSQSEVPESEEGPE